jgi:EGF domain-specific O-GlcNAc transferase
MALLPKLSSHQGKVTAAVACLLVISVLVWIERSHEVFTFRPRTFQIPTSYQELTTSYQELPAGNSSGESAPVAIEPPSLPAAYSLSAAQHLCEDLFGQRYLTHMAETQHSYTAPHLRASFDCFQAERPKPPWRPGLWLGDWTADHFCLAKGAYYKGQGGKSFSLPCHTLSQASDDFPLLDDMPTYWGDTGIGPQAKEFEFGVSTLGDRAKATCPDIHGSGGAGGSWIMLVRREEENNIWHQAMTIWQAMLTLDALRIAVHPKTGVPWMTAEQADSVIIVLDDDRTEMLEDWWMMLTGRPPIRRSELLPGQCFAGIILPLAGSSSPFWHALGGESLPEPCSQRFLINALTRRVFDHLDISARPLDGRGLNMHPSITVIDRQGTREIEDMEILVALLESRQPESDITVVDFADLSVADQIQLVQDTDILVGYHGAAMGHLLYLPPASAVVEIIPPNFHNAGFRTVSQIAGHVHFTVDALTEEQWEARQPGGTPLPEGYTVPQTDDNWFWKMDPFAYVDHDDLLRVIDAAVLQLRNREAGFRDA